jgi:hypothetical protein
MMNFLFVLVVWIGLNKSCSGFGFFSLRLPNDNAFGEFEHYSDILHKTIVDNYVVGQISI